MLHLELQYLKARILSTPPLRNAASDGMSIERCSAKRDRRGEGRPQRSQLAPYMGLKATYLGACTRVPRTNAIHGKFPSHPLSFHRCAAAEAKFQTPKGGEGRERRAMREKRKEISFSPLTFCAAPFRSPPRLLLWLSPVADFICSPNLLSTTSRPLPFSRFFGSPLSTLPWPCGPPVSRLDEHDSPTTSLLRIADTIRGVPSRHPPIVSGRRSLPCSLWVPRLCHSTTANCWRPSSPPWRSQKTAPRPPAACPI